jgi:hypothetical protein
VQEALVVGGGLKREVGRWAQRARRRARHAAPLVRPRHASPGPTTSLDAPNYHPFLT